LGFWIFMLVMDLLIPLTMIYFGRYFSENAPEKINRFFGYRTFRSMKNRETWEFAHSHFGRAWFRLGIILLPLTVIAMAAVFFVDSSIETVAAAGVIICMAQAVFMLLPVISTELALRKQF